MEAQSGRVGNPLSFPHRTAVVPTILLPTRRVDFTNPVARILPKSLPNSCGNLIAANTSVTWIYNRITLDINVATDAALRKTPILIARQATRVEDWNSLNAFLGNEPFVLMIDGLNTLCPIVEPDLAAVLKEHFLDRKDRHLVITSYQPFLTEGKGDTTVSAGAADASGQLWGDRPLTIVPMPVYNDRFYSFSSDVQVHSTLGVCVKWPLCYITFIFRHFAGQDLLDYNASSVDVLAKKCETVGDAGGDTGLHPWICALQKKFMGQAVETTDDVRRTIEEHCTQFQKDTIVLYVSTGAALCQFDGYCVRFKDNAICQVSGCQGEDNSKGTNSPMPTWITKGGHLFRSNAPHMCKAGGRSTDGWIYYNAEDTDAFLGWSLQIMRV
eukprot:gene25317-30571_t